MEPSSLGQVYAQGFWEPLEWWHVAYTWICSFSELPRAIPVLWKKSHGDPRSSAGTDPRGSAGPQQELLVFLLFYSKEKPFPGAMQ